MIKIGCETRIGDHIVAGTPVGIDHSSISSIQIAPFRHVVKANFSTCGIREC
jgi:hypothetical protein